MKIWGIGLCSLLLAATSAAAQQPAANPAPAPGGGGRNPFAACKADAASLCKDAPSGISGRLQCLKANQDKLSPECMGVIRAVLGTVQAKAAAMENAPRPVKACQQELATLCPDITVGEGGRFKCLRDNAPKLSPSCAESLKAARAQAQERLKACDADRARLCSTAGQKPADQLKCLREKQDELGSECRQLITAAKATAKSAASAARTEAAAPPSPQLPPAPALKPSQSQ
jgi:hypothetical protein